MTNFPWLQHLSLNNDPNWQVKTFTDILLNIMTNFVPNETKRFVPRDPPWITRPLRKMLKRKNRLYKSYKRHGYKEEDKVRLDTFRTECHQAVEDAKLSYLTNLGNKANEGTSQKLYWKIINRVMNKCRAPKIPSLLVNNVFILNCREKTNKINELFSNQCMPITNSSVLPRFNFLTDKRVDQISIRRDEIISLVRNLNPNKASDSDGISGQMLILCDDTLTVPPLKMIFENILITSLYPDSWKLANVTPIFKKGDKQSANNYRPISLLPICGKMLEKIIFNNLYSYLNANNLITKNQLGFRPGDSTTNQLFFLVDEIH